MGHDVYRLSVSTFYMTLGVEIFFFATKIMASEHIKSTIYDKRLIDRATSFPAIRACIFDMDGHLINSEDIITLSINHLLAKIWQTRLYSFDSSSADGHS
jgi:hypothetical protein